jgi:assimilatory nitrate reductase catalytic subunit
MGGREVGGMANLLSAHRDLANPAHRAEVAALWGVPAVPASPGLTAVELFEAAAAGKIKVLWIACTNPAQSMPDQALVRKALETVELVIVQEAFATTATVDYADVLLPATTWAEKEGTVTNSERRITRVRAALPKPGACRHDWEIVCGLAGKLAPLLGKPAAPLVYEAPESIWNEHRESTRGRDLDITGLSYTLLEEQGPQQWPYPAGAASGKLRLYTDGVFATSGGKARFIASDWKPVAEPVDARYPIQLNTGRLRDQWHGMSRSGTVANAFSHAAEPRVLMSRADMERRLLQDGDLVHVTSRRGSQVLPAQASEDMRSGQAFIPMHWGQEYLSGRSRQGAALGVNGLTQPVFDPVSKQPELKHAAVKIQKAELPWRFAVFGWTDEHRALALQRELRPLMKRFAFSSCTLFGSNRTGVLLRAADDDAADIELVHQVHRLFDLDGPQVQSYDDKRKGASRRVAVEQGRLRAVALAGDTAAEHWLKQILEQEAEVAPFGRMLLAPTATAPQGFRQRGKVVCSCFNVAQDEIEKALGELDGVGDKLAALQAKLKCGTNCGSCVPEIRQMLGPVLKAG